MSSLKVMPSFIIKLMNLSRTLPAKERKILAENLSKLAGPILDANTKVERPDKSTIPDAATKAVQPDNTAIHDATTRVVRPGKEIPGQGNLGADDDSQDEVFYSTGVRNERELAQMVQTLLESSQYAGFPAKKVLPLLASLRARFQSSGAATEQSIAGTLDFFMGKTPTKTNFEDMFFSVSPDEQAKRVSEQMNRSAPGNVFGDTSGETDPQYTVEEEKLKGLV